MQKQEARNLFRKKRDAITPTEKMKWDDLLLIRFQSLELPYINIVLSFYPIEQRNEVNTFLVTDYLHFRNPNLVICYPRTHADLTMDAVICSADSIFEANEWNVPEPEDTEIADPAQLDLVIVPLLAFDRKGNRAGYGKGYFDRYLKQCRTDCIKIGLSYFDPVESIDDASDYDVPLDLCITPRDIYVF